ncbi:MAG TPA: ATP-binding cassette domain-containing protein, partial [Magnetospirillaceae bacterium]|nr:ATP-binding cassette domain-containing protein [Magnetospirillaceae bacterium]
MAAEILLEAEDLRKTFLPVRGLARLLGDARDREVYAIDGVSFAVGRGEVLGIIGESGCGKTTTARMLVGLVRPDSGSLRFKGRDIASLGGAGLSEYRRKVQMVFQDPYEYLNPRMTLRDIVCEPLVVNKLVSGSAEKERIAG